MYVCIYLQPENSETLCSNIVHVAERDAPTLVQQASVVATKFRQAFSLFNSCHLTYDSKEFLDEDTLQEIGTCKCYLSLKIPLAAIIMHVQVTTSAFSSISTAQPFPMQPSHRSSICWKSTCYLSCRNGTWALASMASKGQRHYTVDLIGLRHHIRPSLMH